MFECACLSVRVRMCVCVRQMLGNVRGAIPQKKLCLRELANKERSNVGRSWQLEFPLLLHVVVLLALGSRRPPSNGAAAYFFAHGVVEASVLVVVSGGCCTVWNTTQGVCRRRGKGRLRFLDTVDQRRARYHCLAAQAACRAFAASVGALHSVAAATCRVDHLFHVFHLHFLRLRLRHLLHLLHSGSCFLWCGRRCLLCSRCCLLWRRQRRLLLCLHSSIHTH